MSKRKKKFSCYIIGSTTLAQACAEILLKSNFDLRGIITKDPQLHKWCEKEKLTVLGSPDDLIKAPSFDFLFSIINYDLLSSKIINLPTKASINYHDALLPAYAGLYATSWAIYNGEKKHGITWHMMNETIDAGDILQQIQFDISEHETAFTLNVKCYEHAIIAFRKLVDAIDTNKVIRKKQDPQQRTFYSRAKKPRNNGIISWDTTSNEIDRTCRALYFGNQSNMLATPKLLINNEVYIIKKHKELLQKSSLPNGTIASINETGIQITTNSNDILLQELCSINNEPILLSALAKQHGFSTNHQLSKLPKNELAEIQTISERLVKSEPCWVNQFISRKPFAFSYRADYNDKEPVNIKSESIKIQLTPEKINSIKQLYKTNVNNYLLAVIIIYFYRINNYKNDFLLLKLDTTKSPSSLEHQLFSSTAPLSIELKPQDTFANTLDLVRKEMKNLPKSPIFQRDIFVRYPGIDSRMNNAIVLDLSGHRPNTLGYNKYHTIHFGDTNNIKLYLPATVARKNVTTMLSAMKQHLSLLMEQAQNNTNTPIYKLQLLTDTEKHKILFEINDTYSSYPQETLQTIFNKIAQSNPTKTAIIHDGRSLTYQELDRLSNQLAYYLQNNGLQPKEYAPVIINRSIETIVSFLAIIKCGGIYLPLNTDTPIKRIEYILGDTQAKLALTVNSAPASIRHLKNKNKTPFKIIVIDKVLEKINSQPADHLNYHGDINDLLYVIYTSGTTGTPKGTLIKHKSIMNLVMNSSYVNMSPDDRIAYSSNTAFDVSEFEAWGALLNGATLVVIDKRTLLTFSELKKTLKRNKVSLMAITASLFQNIVNQNPSCFTNLKTLIVTGEPINPRPLKKFLSSSHNHGIKIINAYGPTEATVFTSYYPIKNACDNTSSIPIGYPFNNVQIYVLDKMLQPVPPGTLGEIYIGGEGVAQGYLNQPELTQKAFIDNPFLNNKAKLYKSGDLGRWLGNNALELYGRVDEQVKIRGFRVELLETENRLSQLCDVSDCTLLCINENDEKRLIAYIVPKNKKLDALTVRNRLKNYLPEYMLPTELYFIDQIPMNQNGKIDKEQLLGLRNKRKTTSEITIKSRSTTLNKLLKIWGQLLNLSHLNITTNIFDLGANSLIALQAVTLINQQLNININAADLLTYTTIQGLADFIDTKSETTTIPKIPDDCQQRRQEVFHRRARKKVTNEQI